MRTMKSASLAVACVFLFIGCKKAEPKLQMEVPAGWQAADVKAQEGEQVKMLTSAELEGVRIIVACLPADKYPMAVMVAENMAVVSQIGGEITQFDVADDQSSVRLAFTAELEDAGKLIGKLVLKKDSSGKGKVLTIVSMWPAAQDAAASAAFEKVAASADFR